MSESHDWLDKNKSWFSPPCAHTPVVSGKTRQGEVFGRTCLLWQCPRAYTACQAFLDISFLLLLPVIQTSHKYMFNVPFQHEASHGACRINTDGLRVRLRQFTWVCGSIYFSKLPSTLWQAGVSTDGKHALLRTLEHRWPVICPVPCNQLGLVLRKHKLLSFFLHHLYFWTYINVMSSLALQHCTV